MSIALVLDVVMCVLSIWMLATSWREWRVRHHGKTRKAEIIAVKHAIPTGWHKFHGRVDGSFDCDYVLVISVEGRNPIELIVRSRMRVLGGNRVFRYAPGDRVDVLYLEKYPKSALPVEGSRGGGLVPVWLWGFCTITTFAIGLYLVVAR